MSPNTQHEALADIPTPAPCRAERRRLEREAEQGGGYTTLAHKDSERLRKRAKYPAKEGYPRYSAQLVKGDFNEAGKELKKAVTPAIVRSLMGSKYPGSHVGRKQQMKAMQRAAKQNQQNNDA